MSPLEQTATATVDTALYSEVQNFYGHQMRLLDEAAVDDWANTFTEDGEFAADAHPEPSRGRTAIASGARQATSQLAAKGIQRRHWLGMLDVTGNSDGTIQARTYALILETPQGGKPSTQLSCTCDDLLVREAGRLLVRHRRVHRDDLPRS